MAVPGVLFMAKTDSGTGFVFFENGAVRRLVGNTEVIWLRDHEVEEIALTENTALQRAAATSSAVFGI